MDDKFAAVLSALGTHKSVFFEKSPQSIRIFHGRGHCFPGLSWLTIDVFSSAVFVTVYRGAEQADVETLVGILKDYFSSLENLCTLKGVLLQRRDQEKSPVNVIWGGVSDVYATRGDLKFQLNFEQQNPGYFLDIEPARVWLEQHCVGKRVLNLFSYTCAFSVVAAAAGAESVVNIDMSARALGRGQRNHHINDIDCSNITFLPHDIFKTWGKLKRYGPYDIVIIDPPSFQKGSFIAVKDYAKILKKLPDLLFDDGVFLACLNAPEISLDEFSSWITTHLSDAELLEQVPVAETFVEEKGQGALKMLVGQIAGS